MNIQPKTFVAAQDFNYAGKDYTEGETIPEGYTLGRLLALGFAVEANPRQRPLTTTTNTTNKEGDDNAAHN